jgi:hypothetical protein
MTHHRYHLELVALEDWPSNGKAIPPEVRLRVALKSLLRRHGLRCVEARAIEPNATRTERNTDPPEGKGRCRGPPEAGSFRLGGISPGRDMAELLSK